MNYWVVPGLITKNHEVVNYGLVRSICAGVFDITEEEFETKSRKRDIVNARQVCMHVLHTKLGYKKNPISRAMNKNHATVLSGIKAVDNLLESDKVFLKMYSLVIHRLFSAIGDSEIHLLKKARLDLKTMMLAVNKEMNLQGANHHDSPTANVEYSDRINGVLIVMLERYTHELTAKLIGFHRHRLSQRIGKFNVHIQKRAEFHADKLRKLIGEDEITTYLLKKNYIKRV